MGKRIRPADALVMFLVSGSCTPESARVQRPERERSPRAVSAKATLPAPFDPSAFAASLPSFSKAESAAVLAREGVDDIEPSLHIGKVAPPLTVDGWLADEVTLRAGNVYVIETWATWCDPCIEAMPHLSELSERYAKRGLKVIGVNVEDSDPKTVGAFVAEHAEDLRYPVAYDRSEVIQREWVEAAGFEGVPASFVIDRGGRVAWAGHPSKLQSVIEEVVHDRWSLDSARALARRDRLSVRYAKLLLSLLDRDGARAYRLARVLLASGTLREPELLLGLANHVLSAPSLIERDLEVAYLAAALACAERSWSDASSVELLSKIRQAQGCHDDAVTLQQHAATVSDDARYRRRLRKMLR